MKGRLSLTNAIPDDKRGDLLDKATQWPLCRFKQSFSLEIIMSYEKKLRKPVRCIRALESGGRRGQTHRPVLQEPATVTWVQVRQWAASR